MDLGLKGRVSIVTGGSQGLGLACARALANEGSHVVLNARNAERLERAATEIAAESGSTVLSLPGDVRDPDLGTSLVDLAEKHFGRVDVLVTNAGGPQGGLPDALDPDDYTEAMELTLTPVVRLVQAVLPAMRKRGWGRIVAITSVSAKQPIQGLTLSNVTRPAVVGYLKSLSREVAAEGILCNAVAPGYTATPRVSAWLEQGVAGKTGPEVQAELMREIPIGRIARPEELGDVVAFLASERASYITGHLLQVDGGFVKGLL